MAVVARIATRLVQLWNAKALADASPLSMAVQVLFDLALTLHRTEGTLLAGLQVFEQLIEIDAYRACEFLDELDQLDHCGLDCGVRGGTAESGEHARACALCFAASTT
jgi:hypothetical protein